MKPVNPKGNQCWIVIGRTDAEIEAPILWPPDAKYWLIGKILMLGTIEGRRRSGWQRMRWLDGIMDSMDMNLSELRELVMDRDCDSWGRKELDTTEWLNWTECPLGPSMLLEIARFHSFYGWVIFHCIFIPLLLYPFIYQRALRILLYLSYYK